MRGTKLTCVLLLATALAACGTSPTATQFQAGGRTGFQNGNARNDGGVMYGSGNRASHPDSITATSNDAPPAGEAVISGGVMYGSGN